MVVGARQKMADRVNRKDKVTQESLKRALTSGEFTVEWRFRGFFGHLPHDPRCKLCHAPFEGAGGVLAKLVFGKYPSNFNPRFCNTCMDVIKDARFGAEVEISFVFADVRGSTGLAERLSGQEYKELIDRFYRAASGVLVNHDALIDKYAGDEVIAFFVPGLAGPDHASQAVRAALGVLRATGHAAADGPWIPVGVGVHTGVAYVGVVGSPHGVSDVTALGDNVNIAARLASAAGPGEILVSEETASQAGLEVTKLEHRSLELKGKSLPHGVWVIRTGDLATV
jgi:adenylate cyclase